ncbi:MAG: BlaI/MecI/CopY family transcriptional regulator [Cellulosilyticaceae bacterium]
MYTNITEAEWKVMKVVWEKDGLTLKEITTQLHVETKWSTNTIRTLIVRLMGKNLIAADKSMGYFKYSPLVKKEECQIKEVKGLLNTIFDGSLGMFINAFTKQANLSKEDREKLLGIIEKMEEENGK